MNVRLIFQSLMAMATAVLVVACQSEKSVENAELSQAFQGKVKRELISIAPKVPGRILNVNVSEGDWVKAGDTLAVLDIPEVNAKVKQAEGAYLAAKAQYEMAQRGATAEQRQMVTAALTAAREQYEFAKKSHTRMYNLYKDSLISAQQYDEVKMKFLGAKAQYEGAKAKYQEVTGKVRNEKVQMAYGTMQRAEGALIEANTAKGERFVVAPMAMRIESITLNQGELSLPGYSLITGYAKGNVYLRFTVSESEIGTFSIGKTYAVTLPFQENKLVNVKLAALKQLSSYANRTSSYPDHELSEALYELKFLPETEQENLLDNMTVLLKK